MIIIGIGNRYRQDDAVGLVVANQLRALLPGSPVVEHEGDPLDLLPIWHGHDVAILIDALNVPDAVGSVYRFELPPDTAPPSASTVSSHGHSLWDAYTLASLLSQRPERALIYAIAGRRFGHGEDLSPEVEQAVGEVVARVLETMSQYESVGTLR